MKGCPSVLSGRTSNRKAGMGFSNKQGGVITFSGKNYLNSKEFFYISGGGKSLCYNHYPSRSRKWGRGELKRNDGVRNFRGSRNVQKSAKNRGSFFKVFFKIRGIVR